MLFCEGYISLLMTLLALGDWDPCQQMLAQGFCQSVLSAENSGPTFSSLLPLGSDMRHQWGAAPACPWPSLFSFIKTLP